MIAHSHSIAKVKIHIIFDLRIFKGEGEFFAFLISIFFSFFLFKSDFDKKKLIKLDLI